MTTAEAALRAYFELTKPGITAYVMITAGVSAAVAARGDPGLATVVHTVIGKKHFTDEQLRENFLTFVDALNRAKPTGVKGVYLRSLALTSTMGPGIRINTAEALANAAAAAV